MPTLRKLGCIRRTLAFATAVWIIWGQHAVAQNWVATKPEGALRIATYNVSLNRPEAGQLTKDLEGDDKQAREVAAIIRAVQPDILLINELDYADTADNAKLFAGKYLADETADALGGSAWDMPFQYSAPVNTGVASGLDLNGDGKVGGPNDAWGYGRFPGQYGMAVLSRYELDSASIRTFQNFLWSKLPDALRPKIDGKDFYEDDVWNALRLSSKSFWDVPVKTPSGVVHVLASHPTPPAFDGEEDRNGCRNHDEVKLLQAYIEDAPFLFDDAGKPGGIAQEAAFVILGDLNSDPNDGGSRPEAIKAILSHERVAQFAAPTSKGAVQTAKSQGGANDSHRGNAAEDTGDFNDRSVGNLRIDYALPSRNMQVLATGVVWPELSEVAPELREALKKSLYATDHHMVWVDVRLK